MIRTLFVPGALLVCMLSVSSAGTGKDRGQDVVRAARRAALEKLCREVLALKADEESVGEILSGNAALKADAAPLVAGAKEQGVPRTNPDGTCEVSLSIEVARVVENLRKLAPDSGEKFERLDAKRVLEATGSQSYRGAPVRPRRDPLGQVKGWAGVSGKDRLRAERAAFEKAARLATATALDVKLSKDLGVKDFLAKSEKASPAFKEALLSLRPASKAYLPGGIVEVVFRLTGDKLVTILKEINKEAVDEENRLKAEVFLAAAEELKTDVHTSRGYASVSGKAADEEVLNRVTVVDPKAMPKIVLKELEGAK